GSDSRGPGGNPQRGKGTRRQRPREREVLRNGVSGAGDGGSGNGADSAAPGGEHRRSIGKGLGGFGGFVIRSEKPRLTADLRGCTRILLKKRFEDSSPAKELLAFLHCHRD